MSQRMICKVELKFRDRSFVEMVMHGTLQQIEDAADGLRATVSSIRSLHGEEADGAIASGHVREL